MQSVLIYSNKVSPLPWDGQLMSHSAIFSTWEGYLQTNVAMFVQPNGSSYWRDIDGNVTALGVWTTTPGTSYEVNSIVTAQDPTPGGVGWTSMASGTGGWVPVSALGTQAAILVLERTGTAPANITTINATFEISVRKAGDITPIVVSTFYALVSMGQAI